MPIRVAIVDDHPFVRQGLRGFLERESSVEVVGEAADGEQAVALARRTLPDIMLMDLVMPDVDGVEATRRITTEHADVRVIVLTSFGSADDVVPAIAAGASGYVLKDVEPDDLVAAISVVHRGQTLWSQEVAAALRAHVADEEDGPTTASSTGTARGAMARRLAPQTDANGVAAANASTGEMQVSDAERRRLDLLTPRERQVLALMGHGHTNAEIADELVVAQKTIKTHVSHILAKLRVDDRTKAAVLAVRAGWVDS